jgi:hypothetical protein
MKLLILAAAAGLTFASAAGAASNHAPPGCFLTQDLRSHTIDGKDTVYLNVNGTDTYQVKTDPVCLAHATTHEGMTVKDRGLGTICHSNDLEIIVRGAHCHIASLTKLSPAEASALPKALQP